MGTMIGKKVTIQEWLNSEKFINGSSPSGGMQRKPYLIGIDHRKVKKWLSRNTRVSVQNPWYAVNEDPDAEVVVQGVCHAPVEVITLKKSGSLYPYIIRPDAVPHMGKALEALQLDPLQVGFHFCPPDKVPAEFHNRELKVYRQAVQYAGDFDATLYGPANRHLRQNLARGEKNGLLFERLQYKASEVSDLVIAWTVAKQFGSTDVDGHTRGFKNANRIANVAFNPFGVVYGVRNRAGELRAVAATLEMGDYVSVECIASHRDVDRAQEFLETRMWQEFAKKGIRVVGRGNMDKQSPSLREYKEKFAPMHVKEWVYTEPILTKAAPLYREF